MLEKNSILVLWWSERTDRDHVDMSFITPLIKTTIVNVSSEWYYTVCNDERYEGLIRTLPVFLLNPHISHAI